MILGKLQWREGRRRRRSFRRRIILPRVRGERRESVSHYSLLVSQPSESIYFRTESFEELRKVMFFKNKI